MVIQACQNYEHQAPLSSVLDAQEGSSNESMTIELSRPHTLLLRSSITGGFATRGAYTGALANQIAKADGVTTITDMETAAKTEMFYKHPDTKKQIPEMRSLLMKKLILPPAKQCR